MSAHRKNLDQGKFPAFPKLLQFEDNQKKCSTLRLYFLPIQIFDELFHLELFLLNFPLLQQQD